MFIERLILSNFRCFGADPTEIDLSADLTAFVGSNGSGKTAVMVALQRMFGITADQRRIRRADFHVPAGEDASPNERVFIVEAVLAFPELADPKGDHSAIPEFFQQMITDEGGKPKCRLRLEATWVDDGSTEGAIDQRYWAVRKFGEFKASDCSDLKAADRARIQLIYVPAIRDAAAQVTAFLRGRLWRAAQWSTKTKNAVTKGGKELNDAFDIEPAVRAITGRVEKRWNEVHSGGTDTKPRFRPVDLRIEELVRKVEVAFQPDEAGRDRSLSDLSDGQRSLFHLAMTAATLDVESELARKPELGFNAESIALPALTLIAVEEPENNLAPFYLSRIVDQIQSLTKATKSQAVLSSHSPSILARVAPEQVRHFRLDAKTRTTLVNKLNLPTDVEEESKFIREAVMAYPEMYFARFIVFGEGATEEIVIPKLAAALGVSIDRSFVAVVPLGGRHVNHLWRLAADLKIPHATLLDLDWGRGGAGWARIKYACDQLLKIGVPADAIWNNAEKPTEDLLAKFGTRENDYDKVIEWAESLREHNVFFCYPLDLDFSMLIAYPHLYRVDEPGRTGPSGKGDAIAAVLGDGGIPELYDGDNLEDDFRWYRYLFLGRGKPSTHVRVLANVAADELRKNIPEELKALIDRMSNALDPKPANPGE